MSEVEVGQSRAQGQINQYLTFQLGDEIYAIDVSKVREILDLPQITKVPRTPEYMLGVINLRGSVVPVVNLSRKFEIACKEQTRDTCIIVIEVNVSGEQIVIGTQADSVQEVVDLSDDQIEPPPSIGTSLDVEFIQGMGKYNDQFLIILDIDKIFSDVELNLLSQQDGSSDID